MNNADIFISQYDASLRMLKNAIEASDDALWYGEGSHNKFWQVAYHALFYTNLYLSPDDKHFTPWEKHQDDYQVLGDKVPWPPHHAPRIGKPYTRNEVLAYCEQLHGTLAEHLEPLDFEQPSGFFWLPFTKFELQIYNIRHIQHHAGQLIDRLRERKNIGVEWVGMRSR
jgi:hypothetical protein